MERFCNKCGTLVSGDGKFCPQCGEPMESAVDLSKPSDPAFSQPAAGSMPTAQQPIAPAPVPQQNTYNTTGNYAQMPNYNMNNSAPAERVDNMSVGQWVGFILLTSAIPLVSLILLFVYAFGDYPQPKKNYCRAMLILAAIGIGIYILMMIGTVSCIGCLGGSLGGSLNSYSYY